MGQEEVFVALGRFRCHDVACEDKIAVISCQSPSLLVLTPTDINPCCEASQP